MLYDSDSMEPSVEWDEESLRAAAKTSASKREILRKLGKRDTGSIYLVLNRKASEWGIPLPDGTYLGGTKRKSIEEIFSYGSGAKGHTLRKHMIRRGILYRCSGSSCPMPDPVWGGRALTLEVDHIDGNHLNNEFQNLRFLCPNCHSLEKTSHRNKKSYAA